MQPSFHRARRCRVSALLALLTSTAAGGAAATAEGDRAWLDNGVIRVGLLNAHGGAIAHLSLSGGGERIKVLNHFDHGRLVSQSFYGDGDGSDWNGRPWRFNPVQGGD